MKEPGVGQVDLGGADLALLQDLVPGLELDHGKRRREKIQVPPDSVVAHTKGTGELGGIPDLAVIVGQHVPEPPQARGSDGRAELPQVSLQEGAYEVLAPCDAPCLRPSKVGRR